MIPKWIILSLIPPLVWAVTYHLDKITISKFGKGVANIQLALLSGLGSIMVIAFLLIQDTTRFQVGWQIDQIWPSFLGGAVYFVALYLYYFGLAKEEVTRVAPLYSLSPIFGILFGVSILGEQITPTQMFGILIVVAGGILVDSRVIKHVFRVNWTVIVTIAFSCAFFALSSVGFKKSDSYLDPGDNLLWFFAGCFVVSAVVTLLPAHRSKFIALFKRPKRRKLVFWMLVSNIIGSVGRVTHNLAILMVPIAFVQTIEAFESAYVLLIAVFLYRFHKGLEPEDLSRKVLRQKTLSIVIIIAGSVILTL